MALESEVVFGVGGVDVVDCHPTFNTAQGKACGLGVGWLLVECCGVVLALNKDAHTSVLQGWEKNISICAYTPTYPHTHTHKYTHKQTYCISLEHTEPGT